MDSLVESLGHKLALQKLDEYMTSKGVSQQTRERVLASAEILYEYIPYAIVQNKNPADGKVLLKFLENKGKHTAKLFGNNGVNCAISMVNFLQSANKAMAATPSGAVPVAVLAWGLAILDLIDVGNSCEIVQQGYYEAFLKTSDVKLKPVQTRVQQQYKPDKRVNISPAF